MGHPTPSSPTPFSHHHFELPAHPSTHPTTCTAAVLCDQPVEDALPQQMYLEYFSPEYRLHYNRRPVRAGGLGVVGRGLLLRLYLKYFSPVSTACTTTAAR